ncbi:hypothetical protein [Sphingobacterium lactis]|uniref:hypothetical protein n=1 Tax=Sphingobacterium lactis TaxID=797291 RepID=UPI003DA68B71
MKNFSLLLFVAILFVSCEKDHGIKPEDVKKEVSADLQGKVWTAYSALIQENSDQHKALPLNQTVFNKFKFDGSVIEVESPSGQKTRYGYDITNATRADEDLPDAYLLTMKSNYTNFYITVAKDYSAAKVYLTVTNQDKTFANYGVMFKQ